MNKTRQKDYYSGVIAKLRLSGWLETKHIRSTLSAILSEVGFSHQMIWL